MRELRPYLRLIAAHRLRLAVGGLLLLATAAAGIGLLSLSGWFITATAVTAGLWAAGIMIPFDIFTPGAGIRFFALARTVARYFERLYNHSTVLQMLADLRTAVFARLARLDPATLERFRSAALLNRLTTDIDTLDTLYLRVLAPPLVALLAIAGLTLLMAALEPTVAALGGAILLAVWAVVSLAAWRAGTGVSERIVAGTESLRVRLIERIEGLADLLALGAIGSHREAAGRIEERLLGDQRRAELRSAAGEAAVTLGLHAASIAALALGVALHRETGTSAAVVVLLTLSVLGLADLLGGLPRAFVGLGAAREAARRLNAQVATVPAVSDPAEPEPPPAGNGMTMDAVDFRHGPAQPSVLRDTGLRVAAGERVAVVGPSGCGKSTVADLLARVRDPEQGRVRLGGVPLDRLSLDEVRGRIGYLTQRTDLFADTVAGNLRIAAPAAADSSLWRALHLAGLASFVETLPDGLDAWVGETGLRLSGGQGRRLALARVVLRDTPVVLLDEPLAGLDEATAEIVRHRLDRWLAGRTAILFAHEATALPAADRVYRLDGGELKPV